MPSNLPSSVAHASARTGATPAYVPQEAAQPAREQQGGGGGGFGALPLFIAIVALGIACFSLYTVYYGDKELSPSQKAELAGIADSLRTLQNKEILINAPVNTKLRINQSYFMRDLFPSTLEMPLEFEVPINTQLVGLSTSGQPVSFKVEESVPIKVKVNVTSSKAFGNTTLRIDKELPVNVELTSDVKIRSAYRTEFGDIIDRLEKLAGNKSG